MSVTPGCSGRRQTQCSAMPRHSSQYHSSFDAASARASVSSTPTHAGWNQPSQREHPRKSSSTSVRAGWRHTQYSSSSPAAAAPPPVVAASQHDGQNQPSSAALSR